MRRRCAVSAFFPPEEDRPPAGAREVVAAEASAVVTAFLARGFRAFFIVASAVIGLASVRLRVGEPAEYALSAKKTQWYWIDSQVPVATGYREPHTDRMLGLGWVVFVVEVLLSLAFGALFWHFWTHSAMERSVATRAILVYAFGCLVFLMLTLFLPL